MRKQKNKAYKKRDMLRKKVRDYKNKTPCTDCGIQYPFYVTDFDHVDDGSVKIDTVSKLINSGSTRKVEEEIAKCELVCSNCHRVRTYTRLNDST